MTALSDTTVQIWVRYAALVQAPDLLHIVLATASHAHGTLTLQWPYTEIQEHTFPVDRRFLPDRGSSSTISSNPPRPPGPRSFRYFGPPRSNGQSTAFVPPGFRVHIAGRAPVFGSAVERWQAAGCSRVRERRFQGGPVMNGLFEAPGWLAKTWRSFGEQAWLVQIVRR